MPASILGLALFVAPFIAPPASARPATGRDDSAHRKRAENWLASHEIDWSEDLTFEAVLDQGFTKIQLGIFDVYVTPEALSDSDWLPDIKKSVRGLLDIQEAWNDWIPVQGSEARSPRTFAKDKKTVDKWFQGLKAKRLSDARAIVGKNLVEATGASKKTIAASENLASYMRGGGTVGLRELPAARLVLTPSRTDFVEFTALLGLVEPKQQPFFWIDSTVVWTHVDYHGIRIVALEFGTGDGSEDYSHSISMTRKNKEALAQHVAQLGSYALLDAFFGERMEPIIAGGLANDLVISVFDEADTRVDGDLRSRSIAAKSAFVPGGNPGGGLMPPADASSRWRTRKGAGYFVDQLLKSQNDGARKGTERWHKTGSFKLVGDDGSGSYIVHAPILGTGATSPPPAEFNGDYLEFIRAYRAAFLHWLIEEGGGSKKNSRANFAQLMRAISEPGDGSLLEMFEAVYGVPLSAGSGPDLFQSKDQPLEGRFLAWLAKQ